MTLEPDDMAEARLVAREHTLLGLFDILGRLAVELTDREFVRLVRHMANERAAVERGESRDLPV